MIGISLGIKLKQQAFHDIKPENRDWQNLLVGREIMSLAAGDKS
jgi:hypothetical protein